MSIRKRYINTNISADFFFLCGRLTMVFCRDVFIFMEFRLGSLGERERERERKRERERVMHHYGLELWALLNLPLYF